jgi:hydrogenase/urease accessory protein HupE
MILSFPLLRLVRKTCYLVGLLSSVPSLWAHDPGLSSANLTVTGHGFVLELIFNQRDLEGLPVSSPEDFRIGSAHPQLDATARRAAILTIDGKRQAPSGVEARIDGNNNVEFRYTFAPSASGAELDFESILLKEMPFGHRQAFAAFDERGTELARRILSARESTAMVPLGKAGVQAASTQSRFVEFLLLGIRHIVTGYDHLLFLLGLLVVCRTPRSALLLITCFTIAHSLTLALSTFGLVDLPSRFVEATIAASILYVGIENLIQRDGALPWRWVLAFAFGLIHGLGFATVLHDLGVSKSGVAALVPLVAFNSGVEVGQLAIAAMVLPILWRLEQRRAFVRVGIPACSVLVAVAGAYWLLERTVLR